MFFCGANDLITIFVASECFSLSSYIIDEKTANQFHLNFFLSMNTPKPTLSNESCFETARYTFPYVMVRFNSYWGTGSKVTPRASASVVPLHIQYPGHQYEFLVP